MSVSPFGWLSVIAYRFVLTTTVAFVSALTLACMLLRAGTYEHEVELNKKVEFMGSFGGPQILKWKNGVLNETAIQRVFGTRQSKVNSFTV